MPIRLKISLCIIICMFCCHTAFAQDKPVVISGKMFDPQYDFALLGRLDGWYFRAGNDTAWAKSDISMAGWQKLSPLDLSAKYADKNGRVEGWFRIKIKLDDAVKVKGLGIHYRSYAPADIYLNGKLVGSVGHTGLYGHPYAEYDANVLDPAVPLDLKQGEQFTLALHIVDRLAPIVPGKLRSELRSGSDIIMLTGEDNGHLYILEYLDLTRSATIWFWVSLTLCVLSWLLALQNHREKVLFLVAGCSTLFVIYIYIQLLGVDEQSLSCSAFIIDSNFLNISQALIFTSMPVILAEVFRRRILLWVKIMLVLIVFFMGAGVFMPPWIPDVVSSVPVLFALVVSLYYIISSWKNLRGAQWSIVAGLLASIFFGLVAGVVFALFPAKFSWNRGIGFFLISGFLLSFPASLLVYVAMRFKEIIKEVRTNAAEVVRLSEEKKEEALNRQRLLEEEVNRQTTEIRAGQARLIQSEKMASLGELTAGIAHEIQNPLNFVNNFSDVNQEMLVELREELDKGDIEEAKAIAADIEQNEVKINHHGKRADAIVKGMLQHSRTSSGQKEPIDLSALADEYLRLAYHGLRAKDKDFNAELVTNFDNKLSKVNVIPQDIGRVFLNVINNAFYAVQQKAKTAGNGYKPEVEIRTAQQNGSVIISVKDNGNGIPDSIKDKIMQPFFTTKPTGEGTGLGLSLSYDIVVKGHGGSIAVDTKENEYTEFKITLPLS